MNNKDLYKEYMNKSVEESKNIIENWILTKECFETQAINTKKRLDSVLNINDEINSLFNTFENDFNQNTFDLALKKTLQEYYTKLSQT